MKIIRFSRAALSICATVVLFWGCGSSHEKGLPPWGTPQAEPLAAKAHQGASWMLPEARNEVLLYISAAHVYVYTYPWLRLVGMLTGFQSPAGICPDKDGDMWIANFRGGTIVEYAHGGTQPIASLDVPINEPQSCAIDPRSGDLAVVGYGPTDPNAPGTIAVYSNASGSPAIYHVSFGETSFCSYDDQGNLFVDGFGFSESPPFALVELARGAKKFKEVSFGASGNPSYYPTPVLWDGTYVTIGSADGLVRYTVRNFSASHVGHTQLNGLHMLYNAWIQDNRVVAINLFGMYVPPVQLYEYPGGGNPRKTRDRHFQSNPFGVAVSR